MKIRNSLAALVVLMVFLYAGHSWAGQIIKLAVITKPGSVQSICAEKFRKLLESRSGYKVKLYQGVSLGTETDILRKIQANDIQMGVITSAVFDAFLPDVRVLDYPFLFRTYDQADRVLDGAPGQELLRRLEKAGFKGLAYSENGFRDLTNSRRPVHRVEDAAGLKIRVMESALHRELWKMLGADPVSMGWPSVAAALDQKTIDGQENPLSVIWSYKLYKTQKYLSLTRHVYSPHLNVANLKWFNGLPEADQKLIRQCMQEAASYQKQWNRKNMAFFLVRLKKNGMIIDESPDTASFRNRVADIQSLPLYQDQDTQELLKQFLAAAKQ
ncbi:MAG: TRAP transporter substrate-binding protein [Deltaproteobacteria bacterium HGW-Deltaproteobacteria-11]|nr:MAG: TRAP transporter substrate-binding protein [Deltaproteobacteria bacterium HGW-Deltaproteobacteria-11]